MGANMTRLGNLSLLLLDELAELPTEHSDYVLVTGAHGGLASARRVLRRPPRLAVFNDAGVGKDGAGISGLELLNAFHIPAAAVDVDSARIGDAADCLESGVISHLNELASELGLQRGESLREALQRLE